MAAHPTFSSMRSASRRHATERVRHRADGGKVSSETKNAIMKAVHEHESHDHKGEKKTRIKLATGGAAEGEGASPRPDRAGRSHGGKSKGGKKGAGNHVNIIVAGGHGQGGPGPGAPVAPMGARPLAPPAPPMGAGPMGPPAIAKPPMGPPVGAGAPAGLPMRKRGGRIDDGAGSGEGRLEKIKEYGKQPTNGENRPFTGDDENKSAGKKAA